MKRKKPRITVMQGKAKYYKFPVVVEEYEEVSNG